MKVYLQVIDTNTGVYQTGMIDEPVIKGKEIENALGHFGVRYADVEWTNSNYGEIINTTKVVSVVSVNN